MFIRTKQKATARAPVPAGNIALCSQGPFQQRKTISLWPWPLGMPQLSPHFMRRGEDCPELRKLGCKKEIKISKTNLL